MPSRRIDKKLVITTDNIVTSDQLTSNVNNQLDRLNSAGLENPKDDIDGNIALIDEDCASDIVEVDKSA